MISGKVGIESNEETFGGLESESYLCHQAYASTKAHINLTFISKNLRQSYNELVLLSQQFPLLKLSYFHSLFTFRFELLDEEFWQSSTVPVFCDYRLSCSTNFIGDVLLS